MKWLYAYRPAYNATDRYLILYGGAGSGKSYFAAQRLIDRAAREPGHRFLVVRKVARTLRGSTFQLLLDVMAGEEGLMATSTVRRAEMSITLPGGSEIIHAGLDDAEKLKSIAGVTGIWIEEATELTEDDFTQVDLRLRGETPSFQQVILTFNPIDTRHWLKRRFFDEAPADTCIVQTTYRDNRLAGTEYRRVLENLTDERFRQVYTLGQWGQAVRGLVYPDWQTGDFVGKVEAYGLDFGYNNPTALVAVRVVDDATLYVDEVLYESGLTNADLISALEGLVIPGVPIYCDSAEPQRIEELYRAGYNVFPSDKSVTDGIDHVRRHTLIMTPQSVNLHGEIASYKYAETKAGDVLDKPVKFHDHGMDAMRYAVHTHYLKPEITLVY